MTGRPAARGRAALLGRASWRARLRRHIGGQRCALPSRARHAATSMTQILPRAGRRLLAQISSLPCPHTFPAAALCIKAQRGPRGAASFCITSELLPVVPSVLPPLPLLSAIHGACTLPPLCLCAPRPSSAFGPHAQRCLGFIGNISAKWSLRSSGWQGGGVSIQPKREATNISTGAEGSWAAAVLAGYKGSDFPDGRGGGRCGRQAEARKIVAPPHALEQPKGDAAEVGGWVWRDAR